MRRDILWDWVVPATVGVGGLVAGLSKAATFLIFLAASCAWLAAKHYLKKQEA